MAADFTGICDATAVALLLPISNEEKEQRRSVGRATCGYKVVERGDMGSASAPAAVNGREGIRRCRCWLLLAAEGVAATTRTHW